MDSDYHFVLNPFTCQKPLFQQATLNSITFTLPHDDKLTYVIWNNISNINLT